MKNLKEYISEAVEFESIKSAFGRQMGIVTLLRHENIDCGNLSKDDFIRMMYKDLKTAISEYTDICKEYNEETSKRYVERIKKEAIEYAEKRYKRASFKEKYIQNAIINAENYKGFLENPNRIFFDFQPDKGSGSIPDVCILRNNTTEEQLGKCFDQLKDNKYFKVSTGWVFKYESRDSDKKSVYSSRPYIDLILDESSREEQKRDEERLAKAIHDFYAGSNYWGD